MLSLSTQKATLIVNVRNSSDLVDLSPLKNHGKPLRSLKKERIEARRPVSRAENKLAGAARAFSYDFRHKIVLDIGSSTGGFTEFALLSGVQKVIAVEKGTNQMKAPLRFDPRVDLREKTDIFTVERQSLSPQGVEIDTVLADVSFVSLKPILNYIKAHLASPDTEYLVMLKPQFEAQSYQLKRGVIKNEKIRREIIKDFESWLKNHGFLIINKRDNLLTGKNGNLERFYFLKNAKTLKKHSTPKA